MSHITATYMAFFMEALFPLVGVIKLPLYYYTLFTLRKQVKIKKCNIGYKTHLLRCFFVHKFTWSISPTVGVRGRALCPGSTPGAPLLQID